VFQSFDKGQGTQTGSLNARRASDLRTYLYAQRRWKEFSTMISMACGSLDVSVFEIPQTDWERFERDCFASTQPFLTQSPAWSVRLDV
jgi:hypothetical protein